MLVGNVVGQLEQESFLPDGTIGETALIKVGVSVELSLGTESIPALQAILAVTTGIVHVAPTDTVANLQLLGLGT